MNPRHGIVFTRQTARSVCRLFLGLAALAVCAAPLTAQSRLNRPAPRYLQIGQPDQKEGAKILAAMRNVAPDGGYYLEFELRVLPRRGVGPVIPGRLWGSTNVGGPISRLMLAAGEGRPETRLLVQGGSKPAAWQWSPGAPEAGGGAAVTLDKAALFVPLAGSDLSAFDLQMPFLYWTDFVYEGTTRLLDRPVDTFLLYPPADVAAHRPDLAGVRVYLDPNYHALMQAEQIGEGDRVLKSFRVLSLVRVNERYIVKAVELRDETSRNKSRFTVRAAALGLDFAAPIFEPGNLPSTFNPPSGLTRVAE